MKERTILIVDDERIFVQSLKEHFLEKEEYARVTAAYNGAEALEILGKEKIDLVILDLNMPVLDGIEVLIALHNKGIWLPIIVLTSMLVTDTEDRGNIFENFGIIEYIEKPVNLERLDKRAADALNRFDEYDKTAPSIGLPAVLRIIDYEKRSGVLTLDFKNETGRIFFRDGEVVDAEFKGLTAEAAFQACLAGGSSADNDRTDKKESTYKINVEYVRHERDKKITKALAEMLAKLK